MPPIPPARRRAIRFFAEHAGYATPPGRLACAKALADAESAAATAGLHPDWSDDAGGADALGDHAAWCGCTTPPHHRIERCTLHAEDGTVVVSLGGVIDADADYRRVVEAELALEALSRA